MTTGKRAFRNQAIRTPSPVQGLTGDPGELAPVLGLVSNCSAQSDLKCKPDSNLCAQGRSVPGCHRSLKKAQRRYRNKMEHRIFHPALLRGNERRGTRRLLRKSKLQKLQSQRWRSWTIMVDIAFPRDFRCS